MGNALETLTRYETKLKRDLYRAIETLHKLQRKGGKERTDTCPIGPCCRDCPLHFSSSGWSLCRASCRPQRRHRRWCD